MELLANGVCVLLLIFLVESFTSTHQLHGAGAGFVATCASLLALSPPWTLLAPYEPCTMMHSLLKNPLTRTHSAPLDHTRIHSS